VVKCVNDIVALKIVGAHWFVFAAGDQWQVEDQTGQPHVNAEASSRNWIIYVPDPTPG
jgi:hypothetical protein